MCIGRPEGREEQGDGECWGVLGSVLMVASALVVDSAQDVVYVLGAVHGTAPKQQTGD